MSSPIKYLKSPLQILSKTNDSKSRCTITVSDDHDKRFRRLNTNRLPQTTTPTGAAAICSNPPIVSLNGVAICPVSRLPIQDHSQPKQTNLFQSNQLPKVGRPQTQSIENCIGIRGYACSYQQTC